MRGGTKTRQLSGTRDATRSLPFEGGEQQPSSPSFSLSWMTVKGRGRKPERRWRGAAISAPSQAFEPLLQAGKAAELLGGMHVKTLQRLARNKTVPGYQIGRFWYFRASELDAWLRQSRQPDVENSVSLTPMPTVVRMREANPPRGTGKAE